MAKDYATIFTAAEAGAFDGLEKAVKAYSASSSVRQAAREKGLVRAIVAGHTAAVALLRASGATPGNIALSHWDLAERHLNETDGLKADLHRVEAHLKKAAPFVRKMNGGKLLVSRAVQRHLKKAAAVKLYDSIFGVAMSRFVKKSDRPA